MSRGVRLERLFYELRAESEGLAGDLKGAEGQLNKFTKFVERNPLAAAGALGAALVGVGVKATQMAAEVEHSLHRIERVVPGAVGKLGQLKQAIEDTSRMSPRTQAELAQAADAIAKGGVESVEALQQRLVAGARAADASGGDLVGILGGLDQALDLFGASSAESEEMLAKLFATAKGRVPMEDLFAALQAAAPTIRDLKLDFDTAARALGALLEQGKTAKQAGSELKAYGELGAEGAAAIAQLAQSHVIATNAIEDYGEAVRDSRETMESSWQIAKNNFAAVMIDLGQTILPLVTAELRGIVGLLDRFNGSVASIPIDARVEALRLGPSRTGRGATAAGLRGTARQLNRDARAGLLDLSGASLEDLARMQQTLIRIRTETGASADEFFALSTAIANAQKEATKLALAQRGAGPGIPSAGAGRVLTPEEIKAQQAADAQMEKLRKTALEGGARADAAIREWEKDQDERRRQLSEDFKQWSVEQTKTLIDDIERHFQQLIAAAEKEGLTEIANAYRDAMKVAVDAQRALEDPMRAGSGFLEEVSNANVVWTEQRDTIGEVVEQIANATAGALALANAFGIVDDKTARLVSSMTAIAQNWKAAASGDVGSILQVAGGFAQIIRTAFGRGPSQAENDASARAIDRLADRLGDLLGANVSGNQFGRIRGATSDYVSAAAARREEQFRTGRRGGALNAREFYEALGIPFDDVQRVAATLGVTLNGTAESFRNLERALAEADFAAYLDSFAGQLDLLSDRFEVYGVTDPTAKFRAVLDALMDPETGAPAIFTALAGLDLNSPEGQAQARTILQGIFDKGAVGGFGTDLGGLGPEQLIAVVKQLLGYLGVAAPGTSATGSSLGVIAGFRGLTEAAGNRMADYLRENVDVSRQILAAILALRTPDLQPPALGGGTSALGGASVAVSVQFTQNNYGVTDTAGVGAAAAQGVQRGVEEGITATGLRRAMIAAGDLRALPA